MLEDVVTVSIPYRLRLKEILETARLISALPNEGVAWIDFRQMNHCSPFAMVMLSSAISRKRLANPGLTLMPRNYMHHGYHGHMGFFRAAGFQIGKHPGAAQATPNLIPVTLEAISPLIQESKDSGRPVGELVEEMAFSLAEVLCRQSKGELFKILAFALREIIRNTAEHSRSPSVEYCAQYWPEIDRVELAVVDRGIGVHASLLTNPSLKIIDERHAINMALLPGISRNVNQAHIDTRLGVWENSGFGLFMTQRMCRFGGDFFLASGDSGKYLKNETHRWFDFGFSGTAVRMVLKPSSLGNISESLKRFEDDAKRIAKENNINIPNASTASRMVNLQLYE